MSEENVIEQVEIPVKVYTLADLPTVAGTVLATEAKFEAKQYIEALRDGENWVTESDAESFLVASALPYFVGMNSENYTKHQLTREKNTLILRLG